MNKSAQWNVPALLATNITGAVLLLSWWFEGSFSREYWDMLDQKVFYFLNGSLETGHTWQLMWGIANRRSFDLVSGIIMMLLYAHFAFADGGKYLRERIAIFIVIVLFSAVIIELVKFTMDIRRQSPTRILQPVFFLSDLVPHVNPKDSSGNSFPGDHTLVLSLWTAYMWFFARRWYGIAMIFVTIVFSMPRLVAGAHWLTDDVVGSLSPTLMSVGWLIFTPLYIHGLRIVDPFAGKLEKLVNWILTRLRILKTE
jgi:membrane-associated phospholipid phosphatase